MTKNSEFDNCVYFDDQLSAIYDETRPFRSDESPILAELCTRLIDMHSGEKYIRLLDVGSGTGRIIIPLAESYEKLAGKSDAPHLQIHCVEKSPHMLNKLQYRYSLCNFHYIEIDVQEPRDIRDISASIEPFDAVIAHWVFHVISDWRVALLAIDQVMKPTAQIFLLKESSPFYKAIDGDYRYIKNQNVKKFWNSYHTKRAEYMRKNQIYLPLISARSRLGSLVLDARVDHLYAALGWKNHQKFSANGADYWDTTKQLSFFIEKVIRQRAFTNMRLIPDDEYSIKLHEDIANALCNSTADTDKSYKWTYRTSLEGSVLIRDPAHRITREMVLHLLRDTLGRRWRRKKEYGYNQQSLWARLFERIWERLNVDKKPCSFFGPHISRNTPIIFAHAPFFQIDQTVYTTTDAFCKSLFVTSWHDLTFAGEVNTPFCIGFESRIAHDTNRVQKISSDQIVSSIQPHAFVHYLWISSDEEIQLLDIPVDHSEDRAMQHVIDIEAKLHDLIDRAVFQGLIPYDIEDSHRRFLLGLAKITRTREVACAYYFTFRDDFLDVGCDPLGICIGHKSLLPPYCYDFLHSISETIFNEFLEDRIAEKELVTQGKPPPTIEKTINIGNDNYADKIDDVSRASPNRAHKTPAMSRKDIRIFLASSSELADDRDAFDLYFRQENDRLVKQGIYLKIIRWEYFLDAMSATRKQQDYNNKVIGCDIFVSLFKTKTGKYTEEEFNVAHKAFVTSGKPLIYTYFMETEVSNKKSQQDDLNSLWGFQEKLSALDHYYTTYTSIEDLMLKFRGQIDVLIEENRI